MVRNTKQTEMSAMQYTPEKTSENPTLWAIALWIPLILLVAWLALK